MKHYIASAVLTVILLPLVVHLMTTYVHGFATKEELAIVKIENATYRATLDAVHDDVKIIKEVIIKRGL